MLSLLLVATLAAAPSPDTRFSAPPLIEADVQATSSGSGDRHLGLTADVGAPEGVGLTLTFGPWRWLRLSAGPAWNGASVGVRGGVMLVPLRTFVRPTLSAHAGFFPQGDGQGVVRLVTGDQAFSQPLLSRVAYDFVSAQIGVEIGSPTGTSLFLRVGMSRTVVQLGGFEEAAQAAFSDASLTVRAAKVVLLTPSLQLGLTFSLL